MSRGLRKQLFAGNLRDGVREKITAVFGFSIPKHPDAASEYWKHA